MPDSPAPEYFTGAQSMASIEGYARDAEEAIDAYETARASYADLLREEMKLEAERPLVKSAAVLRLMGEINPQSKDAKLHSASSAEAVVESDEQYAAHLLNQRSTVHAKNRAHTASEAARLRASLGITLVKAMAGVL
jgi:hypothetical protein